MKFSKFQIIALIIIAIGWYFQNGGGLGPKFVPDLKAEQVEAHGISGLLTLVSLSDDPLVPVPDPINPKPPGATVEFPPEVKVEVPAERKPRVILLTQSVGCPPCIRTHTNILEPLSQPKNKEQGWTIGPENTNTIQVIDFQTNEPLFLEWVDKVNKHSDKKYRGNTPTFVRIGKDGELESYIIGEMSLNEFVKFHRGEK